MEQEERKPIPGTVEARFLKYLEDTFSRWQKLKEDGVEVGSRETSKLSQRLYGASDNAANGFEFEFSPHTQREDGTHIIRLGIYADVDAYKKQDALMEFEAERI